MATPTFAEARDEIFGLFNTKWLADTPAINGGAPIPVEWQGVDSGKPPPASDGAYARVALRYATSNQSTFGKTGERRFVRPGIVTVQVFAPISAGGGLFFAEQASVIARDAFEGIGTDSGIWFRNSRILDVGPDKSWYQMNVVNEFQYDELR